MGGGDFVVRPVRADDAETWVAMRAELWPEDDAGEHRAEAEDFFRRRSGGEELETLLAFDAAEEPVGFAEVSIRPYAEGCATRRVAYLEGWFVAARARRRGVGRMLVDAAEAWGRAAGCREFASDADPDNLTSCDAHRALGFEDAGLVQCFRKDLDSVHARPERET